MPDYALNSIPVSASVEAPPRGGAQDVRTVLVVDDDRATLAMMEHMLVQQGYRVLLAVNGEEALKALYASSSSISAVIMDLHMPELDGIEVMQAMKHIEDMAYIPVIMTTASTGADVVRAAVDIGVYYCLHKPIDKPLLYSLLTSAIREFEQARMQRGALLGQRDALVCMNTARFHCRQLGEVERLSHFLATAYPDPRRAAIGIGELLINAVEHGNLGISYDEKNTLLTNGNWRETVKARQRQPEYAQRKVDIIFQRKEDGIYLQISDEGEGFEWWRYMEIDPARATHPNGRGIALANKISFDRLQFSQNGSRVLAVVELAPDASNKSRNLNW